METTTILRRALILGAPLALGLLELWHPTFHSDDPATLLPHVNTWLAVHLLQIPLFGAVALVLYLLAGRAGGWFADISRLAVGVFAVFYVALDAVAGVAVGILGRAAAAAQDPERAGLLQAMEVIFADPLAGGGISVIGMIGSLAWLVAAAAAGVAVLLAGGSLVPAGLLMFSGLTLFAGHFPPFGPVAMLALLAAGAWLEFAPNARVARPLRVSPSPKQ